MNINFALLFAGLNWPPEKPWILLITIPALILGIVPFLRLNKKRRVSSKHLIPFIIHLALILILSTVVAGISYTETKTTIDPNGNVIVFVVDMSDSNAQMKAEMNKHITDVMQASARKEAAYPEDARTKFGLVVFGGGEDGIIRNRTLQAANPNDPDAGKVIMPGELKVTSDILYDYEAVKSDDERDQSAIRAGVDLALDAILGADRHDKTFEKSNKRVILMSDGRENVGNAYYALQEFEDGGVALECAYFDYLNSSVVSEMQVIGLETKGDAIDGKKYEATVTVNSTSRIHDTTIEIKDVVTGDVLATVSGVTIPKGVSAHKLSFTARQYDYTDEFKVPQKYEDAFDEIKNKGIQAIKAEISVKSRVSYECRACGSIWSKAELLGSGKCPASGCGEKTVSRPDDVLNQNNEYYAWYKFKAQGKILVVKGSYSQLSQVDLPALAEKSGYKIEQCETSAFPDTLQKLLDYDEIILMDVNYSELPAGAGANIKRFVEEVGRGLLFTAGENIYVDSGTGAKLMADSKDNGPTGSYVVDPDIAELLPVDLNLNKEHETVAMVLVVDLSSSMKEEVKDSPLICKYCYYEDVDDESPSTCPQCFTKANFVRPTRYQVALSSVKKVIMGEIAPNEEDSEDVEISGGGSENEDGEEEKEKKTLQDYDYIGVIAFNQGYHVAIDSEMLGDKENREKLCEQVEREFDHFYYAHYGEKTVVNGDIVVADTDIRVNEADSLTNITGSDSNHKAVTDKDGIRYDWYKVKYTRVEKDDDGEYTGNLITYQGEYLLKSGGSGEYAPGQADKATKDMIKSHGTAYKPAMQEASAMMTRISTKTKVQVKQIVFMSDGAPNDKGSGYEGIVKRLATSGTRTTAIGIGLSSTDTSALEELNIISTAGKGDTFLVDAAKDLDDTLFEITDEISKEIRNEKIDAELIADSQDSIVFEGVDDEQYDTIHGYYATTLKPEASRVFYVDALRPLYAEWEYGLGKVCVLMTDLGNRKWTGDLFDDTDGIENSRLVENILLSPIRNRVDSTGLEYSALRDDEQIIVSVTTYANIAERDYKQGKQFFKEKIRATVYVQETYGDVNLWNTVGIYYATESTGNTHTIVLPTEYTDMTYVVKIEHIKTAWNEDINDPPQIEYDIHGDDPLCDSIAFAIVGQTPEEYNVLSLDVDDKDAGLVLLSSLVSNKNASDLEGVEGEDQSKTTAFFTNFDANGGDLNEKRVNGFFTRGKDIEETRSKTYNIDIPLVILALILFIVDLIFRNFVIKKRKKKVKEMTDEEQLESMRGR